MRKHPEEERRRAVARVQAGESVASIAASLARSRKWVYTWCARAATGTEAWAQERSHRPVRPRCPTPPEVVAAVRLVRLELYNAGLLYGAQTIRWRLEELAVRPLPSVRTIHRIVEREGLTHRRTGRYVPKGKLYPALPAQHPNQVHQVDYLGPCYLRGPVRFWSLNTTDVATVRCGTDPVTTRAGQATVDALTRVLTNRELRLRLAARARETFLRQFSTDRFVAALRQVYADLGFAP